MVKILQFGGPSYWKRLRQEVLVGRQMSVVFQGELLYILSSSCAALETLRGTDLKKSLLDNVLCKNT